MDHKPPIEGQPEGEEPRRVYPPHEVQARLEVSASGLRRLAGIYERTVGPLPRDDRGRVWPEGAVEALEDARALVRESRAVSIEAALRGQEVGSDAEPYPATQRPPVDEISPGAAILEELRSLRMLVEEQNRRISELEEAVRTGRELENKAPKMGSLNPPVVSHDVSEEGPEPSPEEHPANVAGSEAQAAMSAQVGTAPHPPPVPATSAPRDTPPEPTEQGLWRRMAAWFGFGHHRS